MLPRATFRRRHRSTNAITQALRRSQQPCRSVRSRYDYHDPEVFQTLGNAQYLPQTPEVRKAFPVQCHRSLVISPVERGPCQNKECSRDRPLFTEVAGQGQTFFGHLGGLCIVTCCTCDQSQTVEIRDGTEHVPSLSGEGQCFLTERVCPIAIPKAERDESQAVQGTRDILRAAERSVQCQTLLAEAFCSLVIALKPRNDPKQIHYEGVSGLVPSVVQVQQRVRLFKQRRGPPIITLAVDNHTQTTQRVSQSPLILQRPIHSHSLFGQGRCTTIVT